MNLPLIRFELVSTNVGKGVVLGEVAGKPVRSGIHKTPIAASTAAIGVNGLADDEQVDTSVKGGKQVHGGADKAVYMYPSEHLARWATELGRPIGYGGFGENLTTRGVTEADICIGDVLQIGDVIFEVSKPRRPCFKLNLYYGRDDMIALMRQNLRCGWYCRVLAPGDMPTSGTVHLVERTPGAITVREVYAAKVREGK